MFSGIRIRHWRQFRNIDLSLHPRLTVLTGANGTGKTTLLSILTTHFGWESEFVSTPAFDKDGSLQFLAGVIRLIRETESSAKARGGDHGSPYSQRVGRVSYDDGTTSSIVVPTEVGPSYHVHTEPYKEIAGVYVKSHQPGHYHQTVEYLPTSLSSTTDYLERYLTELRQLFPRYSYPDQNRARSPSFRIKEALLTLATFGYGNEVVERNAEAVETFREFEATLRKVLPRSLGFRRFSVRLPELVLETETGDFSFDAVSGGMASLIDVTWQLYLQARRNKSFVAVIDEPENHLHPELQRMYFPLLLDAFPSAQFITATHNPFIVGSVPDSHVYVLRYTEDSPASHAQQGVYAELLDTANKAGTSNEILREVLGLNVTIPLWVEKRLDSIVARYSDLDINEMRLGQLREEVDELGIAHLFPSVLTRLLDERR